MSSSKAILFDSFSDPVSAHILRSKFEDAGVHSFIKGENSHLYSQVPVAIEVWINEHDLDRALQVFHKEHPELHPPCPICESNKVRIHLDFGSEQKSFWKHIKDAFISNYNQSKTQYKCYNCNNTFTEE